MMAQVGAVADPATETRHHGSNDDQGGCTISTSSAPMKIIATAGKRASVRWRIQFASRPKANALTLRATAPRVAKRARHLLQRQLGARSGPGAVEPVKTHAGGNLDGQDDQEIDRREQPYLGSAKPEIRREAPSNQRIDRPVCASCSPMFAKEAFVVCSWQSGIETSPHGSLFSKEHLLISDTKSSKRSHWVSLGLLQSLDERCYRRGYFNGSI